MPIAARLAADGPRQYRRLNVYAGQVQRQLAMPLKRAARHHTLAGNSHHAMELVLYPLKEPQLRLSELARHWQRFIAGSPTVEEVRDRLLTGFWGGELILHGTQDQAPLARAAVLELLESTVNRPAEHADGIEAAVATRTVFWRDDEQAELGPVARYLPDGGAEVDVNHRLQLPARGLVAAEDLLEPIFAQLATIPLRDLPANLQIGLRSLLVTKGDFALFCDLNAYARPPFWFGPHERARGAKRRRGDLTRFIAWFAKQVRGPRRYSKDDYFEVAKRQFPTLSLESFREEWRRSAPAAWQKRGRKSGLQRPSID
jgi:hypothetical protein